MNKKIDLRKVRFDKTATWNIWYQMGIDIEELQKKIDVTDYSYPQKEQDKLKDYMIKNYKNYYSKKDIICS